MANASELQTMLDAQRAAFNAEPSPSAATRRERLARLAELTQQHRDEIIAAIDQDFGHRATAETRLAEIATLLQAIRHARRHLKRWMRPQRASVPFRLWPGRARLHIQPLGVIGIVSPFNYPWNLAMLPTVDALAAGNRVMIKPSDDTPATSVLMADLVARYFSHEELWVANGDVETARAFSRLPFDHLLFTGSARVGREVARAAAENLTPITLELGGKSPAIVAADADLDHAARRIAFGKWFNAGQTCIAPDHVLIDEPRLGAFVEAISGAVGRFYPGGVASDDMTAIISERHRARLETMLDEARDHGCRVIPLGERVELPGGGVKLPPTLIIDPHQGLALMQEEIFGPWLLIIGVPDLDHALARVNASSRPLALYAFTNDPESRRRILEETHSGGVTFNDTLWHNAVPTLPFGGVGESGMGAYHGKTGFLRFSHQRGVFLQARRNAVGLLEPPYRKWLLRLLGL